MNVEKKILSFPDSPGIYLFYNAQKEIIYIGKATSLKKRVQSYFKGSRSSRPIEQMMHEVVQINIKQTDSVLEAIIAEAHAIKKHMPKYNVLGKDNKSWNYIGVTQEEYPQIQFIRQHDLYTQFGKDVQIHNFALSKTAKKARKTYQYLFGPFPGLNTKAVVRLLRQLFYISTCKPGAKRSCLYYQMGQCFGVCIGDISPPEYKKHVVAPLIMFLKGGKKRVISTLTKRMKRAAKEKNYEQAARLRDQIAALKRIHDMALINKSFTHDAISHTDQSDGLRIEGYDISHLGGTGVVGSMVVFSGNTPKKSAYRTFHIKSVTGQDDTACIKEVLTRRIAHGTEEAQKGGGAQFWPLPDLFLIDGGKPQVHVAKSVLQKHNIKIPVVGIAKGKGRKKNEFILGQSSKENTVLIEKNKKTLIAVRDEAHRFALKFQRKQRKIV